MATVYAAIRSASGWAGMSAGEKAKYASSEDTNSLEAGYAAWDLLSDFQANWADKDLVAAGDNLIVECYNDWPGGLSDYVTIETWNTGDGNGIKIYTPDSDRHNGTPGTGFRLDVSRSWGPVISDAVGYVEIDGLEVVNTGSVTQSSNGVSLSENSIIKNSIIKSSTIAKSGEGTVQSCIIHNSKSGIEGLNWVATSVLNSTIVGCDVGIKSATNGPGITVKNSIVHGNTTNWEDNGSGWASSTNNAASDGESVAPPGANPYPNNVTDADFVNVSGDDYHLAPDSGLIAAGVNLYSEFQDDIDGDDRPDVTPWCIGADEVVPVAASPELVQTWKDSVYNTNIITVPLTPGPTVGNMLVLFIGIRGSAPRSIVTPTGWTLITKEDTSSSAQASGGMYFKVSDGTETEAIVSITGGNATVSVIVAEYSGVDTAAGIEAFDSNNSIAVDEQPSSIPLSSGAATPLTKDGVALAMMTCADEGDASETETQIDNGYIKKDFEVLQVGTYPTLCFAEKTYNALGEQSPNWTSTLGSNWNVYAAILLLKSASGGPGPAASHPLFFGQDF